MIKIDVAPFKRETRCHILLYIYNTIFMFYGVYCNPIG